MDSMTALLGLMVSALIIQSWMIMSVNRKYAKMDRDLQQAFGLIGHEIRKTRLMIGPPK